MEVITKRNFDARNINLKKEEHRKYIREMAEEMIEQSEHMKKLENMIDVWTINMLYYEGYQMPVGMTDDTLREAVTMLNSRGFLDTTKFRTKKDDNNRIWLTDNKIKNIVDGMKAYMTGSKKEITVRNDEYSGNDGIEYGVKQMLRSMTAKKRLWEQLWNPAIDYVQLYGLAWYDIGFNRRLNFPRGDFQFNLYHPKDVLFDVYAKSKYFTDARYVIRKKQMELEEARQYFSSKQFGLSKRELDALNPDSEYNRYNPYQAENDFRTPAGTTEFVTVYYGEYSRVYSAKGKIADSMGLKSLIDEMGIDFNDRYDYDEKWQFDFVYTPSLGVVYHGESRYYDRADFDNYQFACIPMINRESNVRQHPVSEVEKLIKYQDIINIGKTLIFQNAREQNFVRYIIKKAFQKYESQFYKFLQGSGVFWLDNLADGEKVGDIMQQVKTAQLPPEIMTFLEIAVNDIKENGVVHESLAGEYPGSGISGVAVEKLKQANMTRLNYKEENINWAVSVGGSRIYKVYATEYKMEDFIAIDNRSKNDPKHLVLNGVFTLEQYIQYLQNNYPDMEVTQAAELFEKTNDVEIQYAATPADETGIPDPERIAAEQSVVYVNQLLDPRTDKPYNLKIKIEMDFESVRKELENRIVATQLRSQGDLSRKDYYKYLGSPFSESYDEIARNLEAENQVMQIAGELQKNPEVLQMAQTMAGNPQLQQVVAGVMQQMAKSGEEP